jgi:acetyl-CoA carboxylase biotin carboxyl carrier protein
MSDIVERIVDLVVQSRVRSVSVTTPGMRVTVRTNRRGTREVGAEAAAWEPAVRAAPAAAQPPPEPVIIRSRLVGVFHHLEPPVAIGQSVHAGETVGVIESMRLPNDVRAESDGLIADVLIEEGTPVEFDQPLFVLSPAPSSEAGV